MGCAGDPDPPNNLEIVDASNGILATLTQAVTLRWDAPVHDVASKYTYELAYFPASGLPVLITGEFARDVSPDLDKGTTFEYTINLNTLDCDPATPQVQPCVEGR